MSRTKGNSKLKRNVGLVFADSRYRREEKESQIQQERTERDTPGGIESILYTAILNNDLDTVKHVYKNDSVKVIDRNGNTGLHLAALTGNVPVIKWLLKKTSIAIMEKNYLGETCAHVTVARGMTSQCLRIMKTILYSGKMKPFVVACEQDNNGMTVLHLAAMTGNIGLVNWLVFTFGRPLVIIRNKYGQVALHFAAAKGHLKIVAILGKFGNFIINIQDKLGATPVFYAAQEGHLDTLRYLISSLRGDPHIATDENVTPLVVAAQAGHVNVVKYLLEESSDEHIMHQCVDGATAFHMAAANGHLCVLKLLMTHSSSKEAVHIRDLQGCSPAHDAAHNGHRDCLKYLIEKGVNPHQPNQAGYTPFMLACKCSNADCVTYAQSLKISRFPMPTPVKGSTEVFMVGAKPPDSPDSSVSRERPTAENFDLPKKRTFRRSADILMRIKAKYNGNKNREDSLNVPSGKGEVFFKEVTPTGPKKPYHVKDKDLYRQPNRSVPLALPYVENNFKSSHKLPLNSRKGMCGLEYNSGESGYISDNIISKVVDGNDFHLARSLEREHSPYMRPRHDSKYYRELRHRRSRSEDFSYLRKPHRKDAVNARENPKNQIDYSKPGASVVLVEEGGNKSFIFSKHPQQVMKNSKIVFDKNLTSSDSDDSNNLPTILEKSSNEQLNTTDIDLMKRNNDPYSYHIPNYNHPYRPNLILPYRNGEIVESIYHDPDVDGKTVKRKYSQEGNYMDPVISGNQRYSVIPPPLPPRPISQFVEHKDSESVSSSVPSDHPPEPEDEIHSPIAPPPAPPPPPIEPNHDTKAKKSLADVIRDNKSMNRSNSKTPKRKQKKKNQKKKIKSKKKLSKIEQIGIVLEEAGALKAFHEGSPPRVYDADYYHFNINPPASRSSSMNTSSPGRSKSPRGNQELAKFSYLPGGVLRTPVLRHVNRDSLRLARKDQVSRRDRAFVNTASMQLYSVPKKSYDNKSPIQVYSNADIAAMTESLRNHKAREATVPLPDFKQAKEYEQSKQVPSELEVFFRQRHQRLQDMDIYHKQHEQQHPHKANEYK